jgi:hypothetical protein
MASHDDAQSRTMVRVLVRQENGIDVIGVLADRFQRVGESAARQADVDGQACRRRPNERRIAARTRSQ